MSGLEVMISLRQLRSIASGLLPAKRVARFSKLISVGAS